MSAPYRIFGLEASPYSVKVRSYFRYKRIAHTWIVRDQSAMAEYQRYAKLPLVPLVVTPDGAALQDSTPILEHMEQVQPEPSILPPDPTLAFLSALVEEYADEWGNKPMFHYRWTYDADQESASERIARENAPGATPEQLADLAAAIRKRMVPRLKLVGSSKATRPVIEGSFERQVRILDAHLASRSYLLGGRPALADFGLYAQLYQCATDPTPARLLQERGKAVLRWIERMLDPRAEGDFEPWTGLEPTLAPLLRDEVGAIFLPWSTANARALEAGETTFQVTLGGLPFEQETQKYHAKSLAALRARYAAVADRSVLDPILERTGCLSWLAA
jgi:glutathione S-transferase